MASFAVVVFIAFAYLVSEGALDWGPGKRFGSRSGAPVTRSLSASVRQREQAGRPALADTGGAAARPERPVSAPCRPAGEAEHKWASRT